MTDRISLKKALAFIFLSICSSIAFTVSFPVPQYFYENTTSLVEILQNLNFSFSSDYTLTTLVFMGVIALCFFTEKIRDKYYCSSYLWLSMAFALSWLISNSFIYVGSMELIYSTPGQAVKSVIYFIGMTNILVIVFTWIGYLLKCDSLKKANSYLLFDKYCFIKVSAICLLIWIPYFIASFPANVYKDSWATIAENMDIIEKSTYNPAFFSFFIGIFIKTGMLVFGDLHAGLAFFAIFQLIACSLIMGYAITLMIKKYNIPLCILLFIFVIIAFSPYFTNSVNLILKDVPYSFSILLLICQLGILVEDDESFFKERRNIILLFVSILGTYLFRNNGPAVVITTILILSVYFLIRRHPKTVVALISPVICAAVILSFVVSKGEFEDSYTTEWLALPLQQTARIVKIYPDELTEEEINDLSGVINIEAVKLEYTPLIVDPVKDSGNRFATNEQIYKFLKCWLKLCFKHPSTALSATLNQNYPLIYPFSSNTSIKVGSQNSGFDPEYSQVLEYYDINGLSTARDALLEFYMLMHKIPVIGLFSQQAVYTILLICLIITVKRKGKFILVGFPAILTCFGAIFGPAIQYFPRYLYPLIFSMPILFSYASYLEKNNKNKESSCQK